MQSANTLIEFFKGLADESRLRMITMLAKREYGVGELATELELTEPTISHHLSKLRELGLVNLRAQANNRYYRLNEGTLRKLKGYVADLENVSFDTVDNDTTWIDTLELDEEARDVLRHHTLNGKLRQIPAKRKKLMAVLRWLALQFEFDRDYTEQEVNALIQNCHEDFASLRREMIDYKFLARASDGSRYWLLTR